jgi:probable F420-dependent oxidoreductase
MEQPSTLVIMKADYYYPTGIPEAAAEAARDAVDLGYDGFFTAETQHDPFLALAVAGLESPDLELGTAITVAFPRSPMVTAMTSWDLARMSKGRFLLGLGTQVRGHIQRRFSTEWDSPGPRLRDYIFSMKAIWDTWQNAVPLRYDGEFYKFSLMPPFFDPGPISHPDIPVYIAGVGPYLSRLAGEVCDGFHVHPFHTPKYLDDVVFPKMEAGAASAGRTIDDVDITTTVFVMTGETDSEIEQAMEPVRQQISFYASTPSYRPVLEANDWDFGGELNALSKKGRWDEMPALVPDEAVLSVGVAAPLNDLGNEIKEHYAGRVDRVGFYTIGSALDIDRDAKRAAINEIRQS